MSAYFRRKQKMEITAQRATKVPGTPLSRASGGHVLGQEREGVGDPEICPAAHGAVQCGQGAGAQPRAEIG